MNGTEENLIPHKDAYPKGARLRDAETFLRLCLESEEVISDDRAVTIGKTYGLTEAETRILIGQITQKTETVDE